MVQIIVGGRSGSAKRSIKMRPCSFVGALWCSKVPPDTFLDDSRSDFEWICHVFQNVFAALPLPKNLRSIVSSSRRKAFRSTFLARPGHKICNDSHNPFSWPKNLQSIVSPIRRKAFWSTFLARPRHKICNDSHNPSAAFLLEGRRFREASSIYIYIYI